MGLNNRSNLTPWILYLTSALLWLCLLPAPASAAVEKIRIEQVRTNLPEVRIHYYLEQADGEAENGDVSATLGGETLTLKSVKRFAEAEDGINYYVLVDVSASIRAPQLEAIKRALFTLLSDLKENDQLALISVGSGVKFLLRGMETRPQRENAIRGLENKDQATHLYDGINETLEIAGTGADVAIRNVAILFTDGADDTDGGAFTKQETLENLKNGQLPLYAFGLNNGNKTALDNLGEIARESNGEMRTVAVSRVVPVLSETLKKIRSTRVAILETESNVADQNRQALVLRVRAEGKTWTDETGVQVLSDTVDDQPPTIVGKPKQLPEKDGVLILFSEAVQGADDKDAYIVKDQGGHPIKVKRVAYRKTAGDERSQAELIFSERPYSGEYKLSFAGITDVSREENPLTDTAAFAYEGKSGLQKILDSVLRVLRSYWWALLLAGLILITLLVLRYLKKRGGLVRVDGHIGFGDMVEFRQHFSTPETGEVSLVVTDTRGQSRRVDVDINRSFFVGRSGVNNLSFDDNKMSRQHFVIEKESGEYYLTDLGTTNGTWLNGAPVKSRRRIESHDVITAGREKFVFRVNGDVSDPSGGGESR